tara:strand:- start:3224 stop:3328 length:105 start_codon:yes stop_codon:yes gene_type:complete
MIVPTAAVEGSKKLSDIFLLFSSKVEKNLIVESD